ncbi:MAG: hypothetical protein K2X46_13335 [Roseomonas sp.]|nr:hypothetical protein [Roseomonas sp.]
MAIFAAGATTISAGFAASSARATQIILANAAHGQNGHFGVKTPHTGFIDQKIGLNARM